MHQRTKQEGDTTNLTMEDSTLISQESQEVPKLNPEQAMQDEETRLGGILQTLGKKTKAQVAAVLFMAMTSGALAGFHPEATAAEKKSGVKTEQVEKEKNPSEFLIQKEGFSFTVRISKNARSIMEQQNVRFDEKTGDISLWNELAPMPAGRESSIGNKGVVVIRQGMVGGVSTQTVEIGEGEMNVTAVVRRTFLKIKIRNSDGSGEEFTLMEGKIINHTQ